MNMHDAIKTVLLAGHYVSFNSNYRLSPEGGGTFLLRDYLHGTASRRFTLAELDEAVDAYLQMWDLDQWYAEVVYEQ